MFGLLESVRTITSIVTPIEILTHCVREGQSELEAAYLDFFQNTPELSVFQIDWPIAQRTAHLRAKYAFTTPDAIQLATALVNDADMFITNDRRLAKIEEIPVVIFDEWTP
jgi:predicted nucleic acid-binding protein